MHYKYISSNDKRGRRIPKFFVSNYIPENVEILFSSARLLTYISVWGSYRAMFSGILRDPHGIALLPCCRTSLKNQEFSVSVVFLNNSRVRDKYSRYEKELQCIKN
jgi:hypothetical protein